MITIWEVCFVYSWEIDMYIREKKYVLTPKEGSEIMNMRENPQIVRIKYMDSDGSYSVETNDGYYFMFQVKE